MSCQSAGNNATPPGPAVAPGVEVIDAAEAAVEIARRGMDPRLSRWVPGFDAPFVQAGLAGYSDAAMRIIARRHGCPVCVTEALLDRMLLAGGRGFHKADLQHQDERLIEDNIPAGADDHPLVGQIIGSDPDEMAAAAVKMIEQASRRERAYRDLAYGEGGMPTYASTKWKREAATTECPSKPAETVDHQLKLFSKPRPAAEAHGLHSERGEASRNFAAIDVNLACPVKKIDRKARGGHWLSEPEGAIEILRAVRAAVPCEVPCTVKLRRAYDDTPEMARSFETIFDAAYELGYAWTTVHARTVEQKYIGPSRWTFLRDLVSRRPDCPVIGSGDVWEVEDIFRMMVYSGVSAVSVARGCIGNPWIFRQAREMMDGRPPSAPTIGEQRRALESHFRLSVGINGERPASRMMRKFGIRFAAHHPRAEEVRQRMIAVNSIADWEAVLREFYGGPGADAAGVPVGSAAMREGAETSCGS